MTLKLEGRVAIVTGAGVNLIDTANSYATGAAVTIRCAASTPDRPA